MGAGGEAGGTKNFNTRTQPCNSHVVSDPDQIFSQRISLTNAHTSTPHIFKTNLEKTKYIHVYRKARQIDFTVHGEVAWDGSVVRVSVDGLRNNKLISKRTKTHHSARESLPDKLTILSFLLTLTSSRQATPACVLCSYLPPNNFSLKLITSVLSK